MKRLIALLLVLMLVLSSFAACASKAEEEAADVDANTEVTEEQEGETAEDADTEGETSEEETSEAEETEESAEAEKKEEPKKEEPKQEEKKEESKPAESKPAADKKEETKKEEPKKEDSKPADEPEEEEFDVPAVPADSPAGIIEQIYGKFPVTDLPLGTMEVDLADPDALKMFTGLSSADKIQSAAVSESMMGAQAYSLIVVKVKDAADASAVMNEMVGGIDPRKWICVEADDLSAAVSGDVVCLMMVGSAHADLVTSADIIDAFSAVRGGLDARV